MKPENSHLIKEILNKRVIIKILKNHMLNEKFNIEELNYVYQYALVLIHSGNIVRSKRHNYYNIGYDESLYFVRELNNYMYYTYLKNFLQHKNNILYKKLFLCFSAFPVYPQTLMCNKQSFGFVKKIAN